MAPPIIKANLSAPSLPAIPQLSLSSLLSGGRGATPNPQDQELKRLQIERLSKSLNAGPSASDKLTNENFKARLFENRANVAKQKSQLNQIPKTLKKINEKLATFDPNNPVDAGFAGALKKQQEFLTQANETEDPFQKQALFNQAKNLEISYITAPNGAVFASIDKITPLEGSRTETLSADKIKASRQLASVQGALIDIDSIIKVFGDKDASKIIEQSFGNSTIQKLLDAPSKSPIDTGIRGVQELIVNLGLGVNTAEDSIRIARTGVNAIRSLVSRLVTDGVITSKASKALLESVKNSIPKAGQNRETGVEKLLITFRKLVPGLISSASAFSNTGRIETSNIIDSGGNVNENFGADLVRSVSRGSQKEVGEVFTNFIKVAKALNALQNPKSQPKPLSGALNQGDNIKGVNSVPLTPEEDAKINNILSKF